MAFGNTSPTRPRRSFGFGHPNETGTNAILAISLVGNFAAAGALFLSASHAWAFEPRLFGITVYLACFAFIALRFYQQKVRAETALLFFRSQAEGYALEKSLVEKFDIKAERDGARVS